MKKNNYSTVVDCGSSELRLGVFDNNFSKLFFKSKSISQKNNYEEYSKSINFLIREPPIPPVAPVIRIFLFLKFII